MSGDQSDQAHAAGGAVKASALLVDASVLRALLDAVPEPVFLKDAACRYLFANAAALRVLGRPLEEVLGRCNEELVADPRQAAAVRSVDERVLASGQVVTGEDVMGTPSGPRVFASTKAPWRDAAGRVAGIIGTARDVTDTRRDEQALVERERHRGAVLAASIDAFWELTEDGRLVDANEATLAMTGYTREELLRLRVSDVDAVDDQSAVQARIVRLRQQGFDRFESRVRRKDGTLVEVESSLTLVPGAPGRIVAFIRDVTDRRRTEAQLRQAQKLESIGRLAGGVAHDFNNLLTVVLSCASALREDALAGRAAGLEEVEEVRAAGLRARDLTRQLLAFARKQVITPVRLDLNELVRASEKLLRRVLGEDVELSVETAPGLWPVLGDAGQLEQVLMNLAVNARDAMPTGGRLSISTANALVTRHGPGEGGLRAGEWVQLTVADTGTGLSPEARAHLFEPFFTTKPVGQGTGLGLATVYGIVEQSGGQLLVESEPGRGTAVLVYLPRGAASPADEPPPDRPAAERATPTGAETILVVEDDAQVRSVTVRTLRKAGYRVLVAESGPAALAASREETAAIHLVVSDVVMPGQSGPEVVAALARQRPGLRVLFVSGHAEEAVARRGVFDAAVNLLPKPFAPEDLLARVRQALDGPA
ncbi:MAG: PAS domain S-box protein [Anaeromyxobacter sp.]|nr:PAS domain S-box protein [Anaeromyxobacter sp.]